jgi:hypothetical protein
MSPSRYIALGANACLTRPKRAPARAWTRTSPYIASRACTCTSRQLLLHCSTFRHPWRSLYIAALPWTRTLYVAAWTWMRAGGVRVPLVGLSVSRGICAGCGAGVDQIIANQVLKRLEDFVKRVLG